MERITFEQAVRLRDAGFPQKIEWGSFVYNTSDKGRLCICTRHGAIRNDYEVNPDAPGLVLAPNMDDILEKMEGYILLQRVVEGWVVWWDEEPFQCPVGLSAIDTFLCKYEEGVTLQEAVANMWVKLYGRN